MKNKRKVLVHVGNGSPMLAAKVNRNQPCRCGSGKKQKQCCGTSTKYFYSKKNEELVKNIPPQTDDKPENQKP